MCSLRYTIHPEYKGPEEEYGAVERPAGEPAGLET